MAPLVAQMKVRQGNSADLPQIYKIGEFGYATDVSRLYIGNVPHHRLEMMLRQLLILEVLILI